MDRACVVAGDATVPLYLSPVLVALESMDKDKPLALQFATLGEAQMQRISQLARLEESSRSRAYDASCQVPTDAVKFPLGLATATPAFLRRTVQASPSVELDHYTVPPDIRMVLRKVLSSAPRIVLDSAEVLFRREGEEKHTQRTDQ